MSGRTLGDIGAVSAWWNRGATPTWRWHVYFYLHTALVVLVAVLAILDSAGYYPEQWATDLGPLVRLLVFCALGIVLWSSVALHFIAPFLSLRLLWLARKGGPSFVALALCEMLVTIMQYLAMLPMVS